MSYKGLDFKSAEVLWLLMDRKEKLEWSQRVFHVDMRPDLICNDCDKRANASWRELTNNDKRSFVIRGNKCLTET